MATLNIYTFLASTHAFAAQLQPFNQQTDLWKEEIESFLTQPQEGVSRIDSRIAAISSAESRLKAQAKSRFGFVPEKVQAFNHFFSEFLRQWEWIMKDNCFQDPCHRFFHQVTVLSAKSSFSVVDANQLKPAFAELCEEDRRLIESWFPLGESLSEEASIFNGMQNEGIQLLKQRLESDFLRGKTESLSSLQMHALRHALTMKARSEGVQIESGDGEWAIHHLYDSPSRLFSALSHVFLIKRNEVLFGLWKDLYHAGTGELACKLLTQCPLLDNLRRSVNLEVDVSVKSELVARVQYLVRLQNLKMRLEQKYPSWKHIFQDRTDQFSKGFDEKLMQVVLYPVPLFGGGSVSKLISSLNTYLAIVDDLISIDGFLENDAKYLLNIINRQYAIHPNHSMVQSRESLVDLLAKAKTALRNRQLLPEEGLVRQKPEQYQSIFLLRDNEEVLCKFKPMPSSSVNRESIGESVNCLLGTDFAPVARGVWLSIRNELLQICFLLETDRLDQAKRKFELLGHDFRHQIYYQIYNLKKPVNPPHNYGELAWNGHPDLSVTNKERIQAIRKYLDSKRPLKAVFEKFQAGDNIAATEQFNLLNVELKNVVYRHLFEIKGAAWAWNGHKEPVTDHERKKAVGRALAETDSFDQFLISRDPKWFHLQGTLQKWIPNCREGTDLLYNEPQAGTMLKNLPIPMVQMYNILALIKGAGDCHSGNTLLQFSTNGRIENLIDCDDEFIMPKVNHYHQIQIWTLGLPQASRPLLRPILRMLASEEFLNKWMNLKLMNDTIASNPRIDAFKERIHKLSRLCKEELEKSTITLTCQDLYFELYRGREKFQRVKQEEGHRPEFILFQYFMKKNMIQYLNEELMQGEIFIQNARDLYS